jgi:hypothetical protein
MVTLHVFVEKWNELNLFNGSRYSLLHYIEQKQSG